jgi:hypothetical protein
MKPNFIVLLLSTARASFWEYKLIDIQMDYDGAKAYCVSEFGGTLAIPSD